MARFNISSDTFSFDTIYLPSDVEIYPLGQIWQCKFTLRAMWCYQQQICHKMITLSSMSLLLNKNNRYIFKKFSLILMNHHK